MPALFDTFRFTANDGTGPTQVYPLNSGLKRRWEREGDTRAYRLKLSTKLLFWKADYQYFKAIRDADSCADVTLLIENKCGGTWGEWFSGQIAIAQGEYNESLCQVEFEIKPSDLYECAIKGFSEKHNWLDFNTISQSVGVKTMVGEIETIVCHDSAGTTTPLAPDVVQFYKDCWDTGYTTDDKPDAATAWRPIAHNQRNIYVGAPFPADPDIIDATTTWAREKATSATMPPGDGWISLGGTTWVRPISVTDVVSNYTKVRHTPLTYDTIDWEARVINPEPISNGRPLNVLLPSAVAALNCDIDTVVSNFFNINPDSTQPTNDAYDFAADNMQHVLFLQKSDVVRASASSDATRADLSLKEFFEDLKPLNLFYAIVNDGGVTKLRIEHYSYFSGANGLDLTTLGGGKYLQGLNSYKADEEIPAFESFSYQESHRAAFLPAQINYPPACATTEGREISARLMSTDLGGLLENQDAGLEGFVLVATHQAGADYLLNTLGGEANGCFAWGNIMPALLEDGRYHPDASAPFPGYTANPLTIKKVKVQPNVTIKFCCSDLFEPSELVNTQLGWGEVKNAEQDTEKGTLTISIVQ